MCNTTKFHPRFDYVTLFRRLGHCVNLRTAIYFEKNSHTHLTYQIITMDPRVRQLYKNLLFLGKSHPQGYVYFHASLKAQFLRNKDLCLPEELEKALGFGEYISRELQSMYELRTYRAVKRNYYSRV